MLLGLAACNNGADYGDAIFLTGTLSSQNIRFLVDGESSHGITVSSTAKATEDVKVSITVDPSKLEEYNSKTGRSSQLPPEGSYSLSSNQVTIKAGTAQSDQLLVNADGNKLFEKKFPHNEGADRIFTFYNKNYVYTYLTDYGSTLNSKKSHDYEYFCYDGTPVEGFAKWTLNGGLATIRFIALLAGIILGFLANGLIAPKKYRLFDLRK